MSPNVSTVYTVAIVSGYDLLSATCCSVFIPLPGETVGTPQWQLCDIIVQPF